MSTLIIVEAPSKAKTISQYVGSHCKVLASWGHVRDLPAKKGSVKPEEDFHLVWSVPEKAQKHLEAIAKEVKKADTLVLATDLDREGEAISWHILEYLKEKNLIQNKKVERATFNAVTKDAILKALKNPREIDEDLVKAYLARLSLDYLVGFTLSPVLWKKLPGSRSAGRVQSVALRLVVEREEEIEAFKPEDYWTLHGNFHEKAEKSIYFEAQLTHFEGQKLEKFTIKSASEAESWIEVLKKQDYAVFSVEKKRMYRQPPPPFITSSLQQEASRKLGLSPARTMRIAQNLYEGIDLGGKTMGLITYLRTDSLFILKEVVQENRDYIKEQFGQDYLAKEVRQYKASAKAQEAHEAIRPTDIRLSPDSLKDVLSLEQFKVYKMIWDRTLASQMSAAAYDQTALILSSLDQQYIFKATGSILVFQGFLRLYQESLEDDTQEEDLKKLPDLKEGDSVLFSDIFQEAHVTKPPGRYSEASLIKKMEELGIGRPSTYARIIQVLQDRDYVRKDKKRLFPEEQGRLVVLFLRKFFTKYVDYQFTAHLEDDLDLISSGEKSWKKVLQDFWQPFIKTIQNSESLSISEVLSSIEPEILKEQNVQTCPACEKGSLHLKLGKTGPFLACSLYPECKHTQSISHQPASEEDGLGLEKSQPGVLGFSEKLQQEILLKKGPYGWYVEGGKKRASIQGIFTPENIVLDKAEFLLQLPLSLGHNEEGQEVFIGIGRFGPYFKMNNRFYSVKKNLEDLGSITLQEALSYIKESLSKKPLKKPSASQSKKTTDAKKTPRKKA